MSGKILGIDLGTTNSAFAVLEGGEPEILVNSEGERTTPSVVLYEEDSPVVGSPAKNQSVMNPDKTVKSVKRHMGDESYGFDFNGESYKPEQISAEILKKMKTDAEESLGEDIDSAVITVPAYFNDNQRNATKNAGEIAGLEVKRIINEPTAAALAYGLDESGSESVLVYDLGGGTFDVTILDMADGVYEVLSTSGDNDLGGDDWTQALVDYVAEEFQKDEGIDIRDDSQSLQRLQEECKMVKEELSSRSSSSISLPFIAEKDGDPLNLEMEITRSQFEDITSNLVQRTEEPVETALDDTGISRDDLDEVILVGGSTRMPMIKDKVEDILDMEPKSEVNPDEAVALGAALQGGILDQGEYGEDVDDIVLLDVTPLSLGVETKGGLFEPIISKNTTIPTENSKVFTTAEDGQTNVGIRVFQGEREIAEENVLLGEFQLKDIPPASAGEPEIEVTFSIDENGIVHVSAMDKSTENIERITVEGGKGLSDEEIERMKQEAEEKLDEDQMRRKKIEAKNNAESTVRDAERVLEKYEGNSDLTETINSQINSLRTSIESDDFDPEKIEEKINNLNSNLMELGSEMHG